MKKRFNIFLTLALAAIVTLSAFVTAPTRTTALSSIGQQTAKLNSMQISYGGKPAQTVQTYLVNNQNFVRVREVITPWDMDIQAYSNELYAVYILPMTAATVTGPMEAITLQTAAVDVKQGTVYYDGHPFEAEVFLLNNRYYFKLQDIADATYRAARDELNEIRTETPWGQIPPIDSAYKEFPMLDVAYNQPTNTVIMTKYTFNMLSPTPCPVPTRPSQATPAPVITQSPGCVTVAPSATPTVSAKPSPSPNVTTTPLPSAAPTPTPFVTDMVAKVVELCNQERARLGIPPLTLTAQLAEVAQFKADDMADNLYFDHFAPNGDGPKELLEQFEMPYLHCAENLHKGSFTPQEAVDSWMSSTTGHRETILSSRYTEIGVGYAVDSTGCVYWTQIFVGY